MFGPTVNPAYMTTGAIPEFLVHDIEQAQSELEAAGVEILRPVRYWRDDYGSVPFRAPDGNVYGVLSGRYYDERRWPDVDDNEMIAQELSDVGEKTRSLEERAAEVERVNARLEDAALTTARALGEVSRHWDAVYEAMRRVETLDPEDLL